MHKNAKDTTILALIAKAGTMTPSEREAQRRSFVFGNTALANSTVTRELVTAVAESSQECPDSHR